MPAVDPPDPPLPPRDEVARRGVGPGESRRAARTWWDAAAEDYLDEHGAFLGPADFRWGPEGVREADVGLLGDVAGLRVLEVGCGAAQCTRWLQAAGAEVVGLDLSREMLRAGQDLARTVGPPVPLVQADAMRLPFRTGAFQLACSSYGAVPFAADPAALMAEVARVLQPGGRWVFSTTHPIRWCFPDDPGPAGLVAAMSYFDRRPYVEQDAAGAATYVESHRTLGDRIDDLRAAGFTLERLVEPEWPADLEQTWGQWSPLRGRVLPGTAIFCTRLT